MEKILSEKDAYFKGIEFWNNNDYRNARYYFEMAYKYNGELNDLSLSKLIQIDLREGKYAKVRNLLKNNQSDIIEFKQVYGLLENIENNFEKSKTYYSQCMIDPEMQNKSLLAIAKLYIQTGDNEVARKMLETLQLNRKFYIQSTIGLVCLNILEENYRDAYRYLKSINSDRLTPKLLQHYQILEMYLLRNLGKLKKSDNNFDPVKDYMIYRLFDDSEDLLLKHISKHMNQRDKDTNGCFFKYTDLKKLLIDAREKIENMNSNHFEVSDMYRFRLDTPIGFKGEEETRDLCVVTMIGTKDILTMYPVLLSDEFDKEGMSESKELLLKRKQGGIKK